VCSVRRGSATSASSSSVPRSSHVISGLYQDGQQALVARSASSTSAMHRFLGLSPDTATVSPLLD
jgi:hypothetical protein